MQRKVVGMDKELLLLSEGNGRVVESISLINLGATGVLWVAVGSQVEGKAWAEDEIEAKFVIGPSESFEVIAVPMYSDFFRRELGRESERLLSFRIRVLTPLGERSLEANFRLYSSSDGEPVLELPRSE